MHQCKSMKNVNVSKYFKSYCKNSNCMDSVYLHKQYVYLADVLVLLSLETFYHFSVVSMDIFCNYYFSLFHIFHITGQTLPTRLIQCFCFTSHLRILHSNRDVTSVSEVLHLTHSRNNERCFSCQRIS